jgi:hypothetical protein
MEKLDRALKRRRLRRNLAAFSPTDSPTEKAEAETAAAAARPIRASRGGKGRKGRTKRAYICPAKQYRGHPDKETRKLAFEQARESHAVWGVCKMRPMTITRQDWKDLAAESGGLFFEKDPGFGLALVVKVEEVE